MNNKLQNLLDNPQNKDKLGTYKVSYKDCDQEYIGQTKISIKIGLKKKHGTSQVP